jgi:heme-degrading monooxygenase HmoA
MDETEIGAAKAIAITALTPAKDGSLSAHPDVIPSHVGLDGKAHGLVSSEIFESIYNPGKMLVLTAWETPAAAESWQPARFDGLVDLRHRRARIIREYGMFERREAVKFYPPKEEASSPEELSG